MRAAAARTTVTMPALAVTVSHGRGHHGRFQGATVALVGRAGACVPGSQAAYIGKTATRRAANTRITGCVGISTCTMRSTVRCTTCTVRSGRLQAAGQRLGPVAAQVGGTCPIQLTSNIILQCCLLEGTPLLWQQTITAPAAFLAMTPSPRGILCSSTGMHQLSSPIKQSNNRRPSS
jgi:hypothetical protein